ncbi:MAG: hypothetical protein Kow0090_15690 [Myxococcota bacterium]
MKREEAFNKITRLLKKEGVKKVAVSSRERELGGCFSYNGRMQYAPTFTYIVAILKKLPLFFHTSYFLCVLCVSVVFLSSTVHESL